MNIEYDYPCFDCEDSIHSDAIYADDEVHSSLIVDTKELLPTNHISEDRKKEKNIFPVLFYSLSLIGILCCIFMVWVLRQRLSHLVVEQAIFNSPYTSVDFPSDFLVEKLFLRKEVRLPTEI